MKQNTNDMVPMEIDDHNEMMKEIQMNETHQRPNEIQ